MHKRRERSECEAIRIVDWRTATEEETIAMFERYDAMVDDWMEKDYGLLMWVLVPKENVSEFKNEMYVSSNYHLDE